MNGLRIVTTLCHVFTWLLSLSLFLLGRYLPGDCPCLCLCLCLCWKCNHLVTVFVFVEIVFTWWLSLSLCLCLCLCEECIHLVTWEPAWPLPQHHDADQHRHLGSDGNDHQDDVVMMMGLLKTKRMIVVGLIITKRLIMVGMTKATMKMGIRQTMSATPAEASATWWWVKQPTVTIWW